MRAFAIATLLALALAAAGVWANEGASFDHQTTTYDAQFMPFNQSGVDLELTSYFSPDSSVQLLAELIDGATESVDIGTPNWKSWSDCTQFSGPTGCNFTYIKYHEQFPIFQATLRAIYRGLRVRILSNNFDGEPGPGLVTPMKFLAIAGAELRYYKSTTFMHAKYIQVDGRKASVSSVNFSFTSFMNNREAGVLISGPDAKPYLDYLTKVFEYDYNNGGTFSMPSYNQSDIDIARTKDYIPLNIPSPRYHEDAYVTKPFNKSGTISAAGIIASPDFAYADVLSHLARAQSTIDVYIYQITGGGFCKSLCDASTRGVSVRVLGSDHIFSSHDYANAQKCYEELVGCGAKVYKTGSDIYSYNHQKYWVIDGRYSYVSTGNWGTTDYPDATTFPPATDPNWIQCNRDFTFYMDSEDLAQNFLHVMQEDLDRGFPFSG